MKAKFIIPLILCITFIFSGFNNNPTKYTLDKGHTYIGFDVERFMVGEVSGRFNEFSGNISIEGEDFTTLQVQVSINTKSLDTNNETRDGHLKGEMWLNTEAHPEIKFSSTSVIKNVDNSYVMKGNLTICGITKSIEFPIQLMGPLKDPTKVTSIGIKADLVINRFDYGIQFNRKMDNGSFFIGNEVKIKIRALAIHK
ncbi:YceI family protein [Aquimarina sp. MMG016]|uniref:YceI family protein n=1 Tax=Aquimarina sp. MMG016 TaxID=2822690 RepID=UPI001B3A51FB|nr:YceI family protein [Aquimarina sp. MMG016]MBQ4819385.1 YceI family protein [Aquimarina sp. MMG016]